MNNEDIEKVLLKEEIEKIFFGFYSREISEQFQSLVHKCIENATDVLNESVREVLTYETLHKDSIINYYKKVIEVGLKRFNEKIHSLFDVPDNAELPLLGMKKDVVTEDDITREEKDIEQLEKQLLQMRTYKAALQLKADQVNDFVIPMIQVVDSCIKIRSEMSEEDTIENIKLLERTLNQLQTDDNEREFISALQTPNFFNE